MYNNWQDGFTYEMYERLQKRYPYYGDDYMEEKMYQVDWFTDKYEDSEFIKAVDEEEAEYKAMDLLPEDAVITSVRLA